MAGRATPLMRPMRNSAEAMVAPVLPAETMADALPSRTASAARTSDESFIERTLAPGSSSMAMTWDASMTPRSPRMDASTSGRPTSTTGTPSSAAARRAPSTMASGAWSPPIASTATGSPGRGASAAEPAAAESLTARCRRSVDLDGHPAAVPTAVAADDVRPLHRVAPRADAARRAVEAPGAGPATAALGLGGLLLGDGHRGLPATSRWRARTRARAAAGRRTQEGETSGRPVEPSKPARPRRPSVELQRVERRPPGVDRGLGLAVLVGRDGDRVDLGRRARARLVAERRERERQRHRLAQRGLEVDVV